VRSIQFNYLRRGGKDRPVILFLHGFLGDCRDFDGAIAQLSQWFCCLSVDLPGHGKTVVTGGDDLYRMPNTAAALLGWLTELNIQRCFLVGYSMGGRLALYLALQHPTRFSRVILESASPGLKTEKERVIRSERDRTLANQTEFDFPQFLRHWYDQPLFADLKQHPNFQQIWQRRSQSNPTGLAKSLRYLSTGEQPALWGRLHHLSQPVLLLVGERDRKFLEINREMAQLYSRAHLKILPNCGHAPHLEYPDVFSNSIATFLMQSPTDVN
jgi:2-succinyl-6-hydroxy-2,4-cyclohexadiene-1-carboxylate synthase